MITCEPSACYVHVIMSSGGLHSDSLLKTVPSSWSHKQASAADPALVYQGMTGLLKTSRLRTCTLYFGAGFAHPKITVAANLSELLTCQVFFRVSCPTPFEPCKLLQPSIGTQPCYMKIAHMQLKPSALPTASLSSPARKPYAGSSSAESVSTSCSSSLKAHLETVAEGGGW